MTEPLLEIDALNITYHTDHGKLSALRGASLIARTGEVIGIVGESGCGKSTLAASVINLLPQAAEVTSGAVRYKGTDILRLPPEAQRALRGQDIAMIFQDPMTAFNPVLTMGAQLVDFQHAAQIPRAEKLTRARALLARVGMPDPDLTLRRYPHQLSGGMRQRVAIAAALLMNPTVLVADEPTTALDVTMEAQIIHLLRDLRRDYQGAILVITHHLGVVAELCDRVYVMYAGEVVEEAVVDDLFHAPRHPYTRALIACDPGHFEQPTPILPTIQGRLPDLRTPPTGCSFAARCPLAEAICATPPPRIQISPTQSALCHKAGGQP
ncbi:ABC transporter ATP-binding protein [Cypionkella aquatica]|uniref:ABC transporter ATP-binding protein n=1 Tax=Cypionkella aquatica TaxID=1756042 RepID=A0AA37TVI0_9RHOB|nr:ABC transporter ATP-binding protein [Cypionkella aquatica]GLS88522.1 ABC transporter ATP-binding protein [Cypionkella aquatica]